MFFECQGNTDIGVLVVSLLHLIYDLEGDWVGLDQSSLRIQEIYIKRVAKEGGGLQSHITQMFLLNHASRRIFLTNHASRKKGVSTLS